MSVFKDILSKLQDEFSNENNRNIKIAETISQIVKAKISANNIKIDKGILYIEAPATLKFEINLKKDFILEKLKDQGYKIGSIH